MSISTTDPQREKLIRAVESGALVNGKPARVANGNVEVRVSNGWRPVQPWAAKITKNDD